MPMDNNPYDDHAPIFEEAPKASFIEPEEGGNKMELYALVYAALLKKAQEIELIPINYSLSTAARQNAKRPAKIEFYAPDQWVVNLTKNEKLLDGFIAMRIPREFIQEHLMNQQLGKA